MPSIMMAKEAVNLSMEIGLSEGLKVERKLFHSTFATVRILNFILQALINNRKIEMKEWLHSWKKELQLSNMNKRSISLFLFFCSFLIQMLSMFDSIIFILVK